MSGPSNYQTSKPAQKCILNTQPPPPSRRVVVDNRVPTVIRVEAEFRSLSPTGEARLVNGVTMYRCSPRGWLGYDRTLGRYVFHDALPV